MTGARFLRLNQEVKMTENSERQELNDRLSLIESMIAQGRRTTESWVGCLFCGGGLLHCHLLDGTWP